MGLDFLNDFNSLVDSSYSDKMVKTDLRAYLFILFSEYSYFDQR